MSYISDLQSQPTWLDTFPNEVVEYGFDENGLHFFGDNSDLPYTIRTNFDFATNDICTVIFTFTHNQECADHGICVFNSDVEPIWMWEPDTSRIAFQYNCGTPEIDGLTNGAGGPDGPDESLLSIGNIYTCKFTYDPIQGLITAATYDGDTTVGEPFDILTYNDRLPAGPYRIGIGADADPEDSEENTYFTHLIIGTEQSASSCPTACATVQTGFKCLVNNRCGCSEWRIVEQGTQRAYLPSIVVCNQRL